MQRQKQLLLSMVDALLSKAWLLSTSLGHMNKVSCCSQLPASVSAQEFMNDNVHGTHMQALTMPAVEAVVRVGATVPPRLM